MEGESLFTRVQRACSNETRIADGEIFRRILDAEHKHEPTEAARWSSLLSARKRRNVSQIKTVDKGRLQATLIPLLPFKVLWIDFLPGALNRVLPMRCREEIYHYLDCIYQVWTRILGEDVIPEHLEIGTVRNLQLRMPAYSLEDSRHIELLVDGSSIFSTVQDEKVRRALLQRVQICERIVTFRSFHADMILLEACYKPLQQLWHDTGSLREACQLSFAGVAADFMTTYVEVWLYSIRNVSIKTRGGSQAPPGKTKVDCMPYDHAAFLELASFAAARGLKSHVASAQEHDPRNEMHKAKSIALSSFALIRESRDLRSQDRCGRPPETFYNVFWQQLSLRSAFGEWDEPAGQHASPFAVARSFVRCLLDYALPHQNTDSRNGRPGRAMSEASAEIRNPKAINDPATRLRSPAQNTNTGESFSSHRMTSVMDFQHHAPVDLVVEDSCHDDTVDYDAGVLQERSSQPSSGPSSSLSIRTQVKSPRQLGVLKSQHGSIQTRRMIKRQTNLLNLRLVKEYLNNN